MVGVKSPVGSVEANTVKAKAAEESPRVSPREFVEAMRGETERVLGEVMEAVNKAADGSWINGSETEVRDLMGEYRRKVFEKALQMRAEAAEGAFSPGRRGDGRGAGVQGQGPAQHAE